MIFNPLRTSTVTIKKRISRNTYEEKYKEEYSKEEDGNEFYTIYGNEQNEFILVREKEE
jgi:hypothetical protein